MNVSGKRAACLFVTGAAAGAILGLLYAPKSGAQTRKEVRRFTKKTVDRLDTLQEDIREQVGCWVEDVSEVVRDGIKSGKQFTNEAAEQVAGAFDTAKRVVEEGKSKIARMMA
jgi:gas vesicle protein